MTWADTTWQQVCTLKYGKALKDYKHFEHEYPVWGSGGVVGSTSKPIAPEGRTIIARKGTLTAYWSKQPSHVIDTAFWLEPNKNLDSRWSYYAVKNLDISTLSSGSGVPSLSRDDFYRETLCLPSLIEQKAIAHILGTLDDKIELNQKMNQTLQDIAKAIFKSWFVDFDPVHAKVEGKPTGLPDEISDLFPDKFVDSELGQIPVNWNLKHLGDEITPKKGKSITKTKCIEGTVPVVAGGLEPAYFHNQSNIDGPVITISASGANAGFVRLYHQNIWASDCSFISTLQTKNIYFWYLFLKINQEKIYHMQQGAAQPHIYPSDLMRLGIILPKSNDLIDALDTLVEPFFRKISCLNLENKILNQLRDALLPKLISGELQIPDAEKFLGEAGI